MQKPGKNAKALFSSLKSFNYFLPFLLERWGQLALPKAFSQVVLPDEEDNLRSVRSLFN